MTRFSLALVMSLALGLNAAAQVEVGDSAPKISPEKFLNTNIKTLSKLKGKLVLYEFFAHW